MTFLDIDESEIEREDKRTRLPGDIVQDVRRIVTTTEIGKATVINIDTPICDDAARTVDGDMKEKINPKEK